MRNNYEKKSGIRTEPCFIESNDDICPNISITPSSPISKYIFLLHPKYPNIYSFSSQISKYIFFLIPNIQIYIQLSLDLLGHYCHFGDSDTDLRSEWF